MRKKVEVDIRVGKSVWAFRGFGALVIVLVLFLSLVQAIYDMLSLLWKVVS